MSLSSSIFLQGHFDFCQKAQNKNQKDHVFQSQIKLSSHTQLMKTIAKNIGLKTIEKMTLEIAEYTSLSRGP